MAAKELPSADYLRQCFEYDPSSGNLTWRRRPIDHFVDERASKIWNTRFSGAVAGVLNSDGRIFRELYR